MPKTISRILLALCASLVVAASLSACGGSVPGNAVATVDGNSITKAQFTHWVQIAVHGAAANGGQAVVPDPPSYTNCIAALRKQQKSIKGQPAPTEATLRAQCKAQNQQLTEQTMGTLIQTAWVEGEAKRDNISASEAEVKKQLELTKKQSFPTEAAYQNFIKQSGMTQAEVLERIKVQVLAQKITKKVQGSSGVVSQAQVTSYYNTHKAQFAVPERRDLQLITAKTQANANAAKAAVQGGTSWKDAAKKYSTDPASKSTGGVLKGVTKGQEDKALDKAAFSAKLNTIVGPVKGQFGWYVVRVTAKTPAKQTSLTEATPQIKALLAQQGSQQKMSKFLQEFEKRWKSKTKCRSGYIMQLCSNAPKPKTTTGGAPTP